MNISTETLLGHANTSLNNAGGDVRDRRHSEWLIRESIAYSLIAIGQELKKFNDRIDQDRKTEMEEIDKDIQRGVNQVDKDLGW